MAGGMVVSDIQLISDKESIPHGYCYIAEYLEPSEYTHTHIFYLHDSFLAPNSNLLTIRIKCLTLSPKPYPDLTLKSKS